MRIINMLCLILLLPVGVVSIWASALLIGLWSLTTPFYFLYSCMPFIMFTSIFFFIRSIIKMFRKEYDVAG